MMNNMSIDLFLEKYPLYGGSIFGINITDSSVILLFDLFDCDDIARNDENYEYILKLEIEKKFVILETDDNNNLKDFFGSILMSSFKNNKLEICCSCQTKKGNDFVLTIYIEAQFLNVEETVTKIVS